MKSNKVFILGGRTGTNLMVRILLSSNEFIMWRGKSFEPDIRHIIYKNIHNIPSTVLDKAPNNFNLCKCPEFDFMIDRLIKKYKNPIFIVMDRSQKDIISSLTQWKALRSVSQNVLSVPAVRKFCNIKRKDNDIKAVEKFVEKKIKTREKSLKKYDKSKIFRIDFNELMKNFNTIMKNLSEFLEIQHTPKKWNNIRWKTSPKKWLKYK